jgi:hypothetical protein
MGVGGGGGEWVQEVVFAEVGVDELADVVHAPKHLHALNIKK